MHFFLPSLPSFLPSFSVGGKPVHESKDAFKRVVVALKPSTIVKFEIERGRDPITLQVRIGAKGMTTDRLREITRRAAGKVYKSDVPKNTRPRPIR
jgi:hypothetical protein